MEIFAALKVGHLETWLKKPFAYNAPSRQLKNYENSLYVLNAWKTHYISIPFGSISTQKVLFGLSFPPLALLCLFQVSVCQNPVRFLSRRRGGGSITRFQGETPKQRGTRGFPKCSQKGKVLGSYVNLSKSTPRMMEDTQKMKLVYQPMENGWIFISKLAEIAQNCPFGPILRYKMLSFINGRADLFQL